MLKMHVTQCAQPVSTLTASLCTPTSVCRSGAAMSQHEETEEEVHPPETPLSGQHETEAQR